MSLDSLDDATFRAMNDANFAVARVLEGIEAAADAGLGPIKINMVVKRGVNDRGICEMAERWRGTGHIVRFIEFMDVGSTNGWRMDDVMPSAHVVKRSHRSGRWRPSTPTTSAKSPSAGATSTARARSASSPRSRRRSAPTARACVCPPSGMASPGQ